MKEKSLFIATPCYGGLVYCQYAKAVIETFLALPGTNQLKFIDGDSLVTRARNNLVADFLTTDCTHLLFIDADLVFTAQNVRHLMEHDKDIVCGLYPKKQKALEWVINGFTQEETKHEGPLFTVKYAGTGFMMISREAILRVQEANPHLAYTSDINEGSRTCYDIFGDPVVNGRKLSEDYFFCHLWAQLGGEIWMDRRVDLKHIGKVSFPLEEPEREVLA